MNPNKLKEIANLLGLSYGAYSRLLGKKRFYISVMCTLGKLPMNKRIIKDIIAKTEAHLKAKTGIKELALLKGDYGKCYKIVTELKKIIL